MAETQIKMTRTYQKLVAGTNINETTLLATDYLNHYNELVMLFDLIPDMPEMLDEAKDWKPKTYAQHFMDSAFSDKELAIAAYDNAADEHRVPFDETVLDADDRIALAISEIEQNIAANNDGQLRESVSILSREIQEILDRISAIINGDYGHEEAESITLDQADIDALFD
jgi:hypothetical protein